MEVESVNNNNKKTSSSSASATATATATASASNMNHSKKKNPTVAQYNADARLMSQFEQSVGSGKSFNYSAFVQNAPQVVPEEEMTAYLSRMQRGGFVQPFGCLIAIQEPTFRIIGYSENCYALLGLTSLVESEGLAKGLIGVDAKTLFTLSSRASLERAVGSREISMLNPIWVHSRSTNKPFYAILHRIDVGIVIDLEPSHSGDPALLLASAVQSQKLAVRAISRLQALPGGDIGALCDTVVEDVQKLTGYDRVMVYKFHEDEHGEVVSEIRRSDIEPYLGLHFPATDIPQAARFLFKQNHVRIICNCHDIPIRVIQSEELKQPICLVNSTLRQPHGCHLEYMANMKCIASLVMSVVINSNDSLKLWGLVVCHHCSPRYVPFPLRYACEFLMQAMGLQLNMELQLAAQLVEKKILRMQTLLCDMLLRDAPFGIVTQSPSIMDLIKCDGAALYYHRKCWLLGVTPTESQVRDIVHWLLTNHEDSTGLSTESLCDAGYPHAALLCDRVCGMATARISSNDFLFWFRSHTANEIKWGGAKHLPEDKDDGQKMQPRSSFKTFLEVTKSRSLPWEVSEINAIHSLQLIMRESFQEIEDASSKVMVSGQENNESDQVQELDELSSVACEMVRLIETASAPIFGVDSSGLINGWNAKTAQLTGLQASEAMGKSLINEVIHENSREMVEKLLCRALQGEEEKNIELKLLKVGIQQPNAVIYIVANTCTSRDYMNKVVGVCFVGQDVTSEKIFMDKFIRLQGDYKAIIQSLNPLIPPIFASDESACCTEWNVATEKLTGWMRHEVIGKVLPGEIFGGICQLKSPVTLTKFKILLYQAVNGHDNTNLTFSFLTKKGEWVDVFLTANKRTDQDGKAIGCFCFLQTRGLDLQQTVENREGEREFVTKSRELAYIRQEIQNPLNGLRFTHRLLESTAISDDQKQFLETSDACERQIVSIIEDTDLGSIEEGRVELNMEEFILENILDAIVSQVMIVVKEKHLQLFHEIPDHVKALPVYGDQIRLQLVLSDFLLNIVRYAPSPDGWVEIKVSNGLKLIQDGNKFIHLHFRMSHPGEGLPPALIEDMLDERNGWTSQEGLALNLSRKLLNMMNGNVDYVRDENKCYFSIDLQLRTSK